jgi:hypothetical protein
MPILFAKFFLLLILEDKDASRGEHCQETVDHVFVK